MIILITAGPTREAIDPVRYLSNRSSGKMGYAIVEAAIAVGHEVILVSGPVDLPPPAGAEVVPVESAAEMYDAVAGRIGEVDAAVMTAAVADYRPVRASPGKIKKGDDRMVLELTKTRDILGDARNTMAFDGVLVGFAAETSNVETYAKGKLERKECDFIVANDVSRPGIGFGSDANEVSVYFRDGSSQHLAQTSKKEIGESLVKMIEVVFAAKSKI